VIVLNLEENATLHNALNRYVHDLIYNHYSECLWDPDYINSWDREDLGEQFVASFLSQHPEELENLSDIEKNSINMYSAKQIDLIIPRAYFLEINAPLAEKYTPLLARRIYDTKGKDGFQTISEIKYQYDHDFTEIKNALKETAASEKQITYLKSLGKTSGYLLWHEEYLTKNYANQMIEYLSEKSYDEPLIFSFFFVSK
jgi:hypothetical protein